MTRGRSIQPPLPPPAFSSASTREPNGSTVEDPQENQEEAQEQDEGSGDCQRAAWPRHKESCKKRQGLLAFSNYPDLAVAFKDRFGVLGITPKQQQHRLVSDFVDAHIWGIYALMKSLMVLFVLQPKPALAGSRPGRNPARTFSVTSWSTVDLSQFLKECRYRGDKLADFYPGREWEAPFRTEAEARYQDHPLYACTVPVCFMIDATPCLDWHFLPMYLLSEPRSVRSNSMIRAFQFVLAHYCPGAKC
ncbi:hypothetical protein LXA43DRAFT_1103373 [Ganoderma leucocontextum]|nr:hypothetical protein LXA43DRAFT_1103373 [Ganoderma leucocontextum]